MRQIILDTETTGLEPSEGHRIIEIGCVELINRKFTGNTYHHYLQPDREIDEGAIEVHGITNEMLADKPRFSDVVDEFITFIRGAELVIHNAPFDVGFLNHELRLLDAGHGRVDELCGVVDTLVMARKLHPGQKNNLDALCKRYSIDNSHRELHGALLDAEILAELYLAMTGGQTMLSLGGAQGSEIDSQSADTIRALSTQRRPVKVIRATDEELARHKERLAALDKASGGNCVWNRLTVEQ
jgi:DNA polymerase-3 subunit epsilon